MARSTTTCGPALEVLPPAAQEQIKGTTDAGRTLQALPVFLFAPLAVVVPLGLVRGVRAVSRARLLGVADEQ